MKKDTKMIEVGYYDRYMKLEIYRRCARHKRWRFVDVRELRNVGGLRHMRRLCLKDMCMNGLADIRWE